jgi:AGZA family xanthine/uracil permease-like MFS transporter
MAYILFVNPTIVGSGFELALMHAIGSSTLTPQYQELVYTIKLGVAAGTAIAAAFGTLLMAFFARLPFAMAPGMGGLVHSLLGNTSLHNHPTQHWSYWA